MLWGTQNRGTFRVFGLALAIALTPALMQTEEMGCTPEGPSWHAYGDTQLEVFKVSVDGIDVIESAFDPKTEVYEVMLAGEPGYVLIRAESADPEATVSFNLSDGCAVVESGTLEIGGGLFTLESLPEGHSLLNVWVHAPEGKADNYTVFFARPEACQ
jgi:hypothetical protein